MSEKNGQGGAHWTKTAAAAAAATTAAAIQKHNVYDVAINNNNSNVVHTPSALYGHCSIPGLHQQQPTDVGYTSGRFQAPPIHHGTVPAPTVNTPANLHQQISPTMIPTPTPTNVPAPSGFVPPPFPTNTAAAATSVLTPNPFAASNNPSLAFVAAAGAASAFGNLEHFQRLSAAQQQLELGKIMNAMNSSGQNATSPSVPTIAGSQMPPTAAAQQPVTSTNRAHAETVSGSTNMGAINSTIADNVLNAISSGQGQLQGRLTHVGVKAPDEEKMRRVQQVVESNLDDFSKQTITQILERVGTLKPVERLLLYLRLPGETAESDPLRQPQNPLGTRSEITHTINWVRSHLEHDPQVSIPKQDVYNDYITYCERLNIKPLSTADFGKVMKQVFPGIRPRRLGTRGNSRYCYAAMRKTTQLVMPQLPQLGRNSSSKTTTVGSIATASSEFSPEKTTIDDGDDESWEVVKNWAEKLLNVKVDNLKELAARIKSGSAISGVNTPTTMRMGPKKYTPREPKEKRLLADLGPLKKRRKKKRKGSSSSESSCNQQTSAKDCTSSQDSGAYHAVTSVGSVLLSEDEQKSIKLVKVKQEIMDSPNFQSTQAQVLLPHPQLMPQNAMLNDKFNVTQQQQQQQPPQQHQVMPMNLATEQRTVLAKAPPSNSALRGHFGAARNLTPKIMEMSPSQQALTISGQPGSEQVGPTAHAQNQQTLVSIKDEVDEYSTSPIFCKKVLKAQQTKGFWTNLPNSNNNNNMLPPIITTTASTPPPTSANIIANVSLDTVVTPLSVSTTVTNLAMGPPAQMANSTSVSPSSSLEAGPKVVSRNSFLLRAKKALASETAAPVEDACLPENLGLPRERVISICNMDKHELDDYFLEEGENEEDQETELLQYFQTGDAEEKRMNSLDAAENRNPTANNATIVNQIKTTTTTMTTSTSMTTTATTTATSILNVKTGGVTITPIGDVLTSATPTMIAAPVANTAKAKTPLELNACVVSTITPTVVHESSVGGDVGLQVSTGQNVALSQTIKLPPTLTSNAVGSASASLALMSQKHQLQQQQQHQKQLKHKQQQQQHQRSQTNKLNANNNKRKISLSNASNHNNNKNCIFLPISPNINNTPASLTSSSTNLTNNNQNGNFASSSNAPSCFASPGLTRLRTRAPTLTKQQSLDFETSENSSDPMIGASRRRRSYISAMPSSTSASAPPSPSVLQQYNSINAWSLGSNMNNTTTFNDAATNVALLADQNSMDLENTLALATAAGDVDFQLTPLNETQRSQSVPLSQLQRIQSPTFSRQLDSFQPIYTADSSVNQTPEFAGDSTTLFSENSNSQSAMKLHDVDVLAQDSSVLLDDVDVSAMLSSPDFSTKFSSIAQTQNAATTCSSTGSSSGYSSGTCNTFGGMTGGGSGNGIISRSVPSTPLPHHYQNSFVNSSFYNRRNDDFNLSPLTAGASLHGFGNTANNQNSNIHNNNNNSNNSHGGNFYTARAVYDISKSMPTTPISTVSFLYSPTRFLINGNTIDSFTSSTYGGTSGGGGGRDDATDELGVGQLSTDTLIDDSAATSDVEAIMAGSDILGNL